MGLSETSRDLSSPPLSFFRPIPLFTWGDHPFVPARASITPARAEAVKVGRRTNLTACPAVARPHLDSFEHDGTLGAVGMAIRGGARLRGAINRATTLYPVGPRTRTMMQSCESA